ncbi:MAG: SIMPL domain-containing protein [Dehalococcoidales bacterium]|nr:SIMPL domain-containing protein [Dehalococcoidales bacterium]
MTRKILLFVATSVLVLTGLFLYGCQASTTGSSAAQQQGLWVTGEGKVQVTPDIANVQLGIEAQAATVAEAQNQANSAMTSVMNALKASGVADKDIQTRYFSIQKVTRWDDEKQQEITIGYRVSNVVNAKIREIQDGARVGTVIDAVTQAGGDLTRVDSITFDVDDPIRFYDQAREKAMADASDKAKSLATLAGVKLGKAIYINEYSASTVSPMLNYARAEAGMSDATQISAGELEIALTIQVVYAIR